MLFGHPKAAKQCCLSDGKRTTITIRQLNQWLMNFSRKLNRNKLHELQNMGIWYATGNRTVRPVCQLLLSMSTYIYLLIRHRRESLGHGLKNLLVLQSLS